jgi:Glycosyltransferase family 87
MTVGMSAAERIDAGRSRISAGLARYAGRPTLVAIAAMNVMTGAVAAWILAPLSFGADVETYRRGAEGIRDGVYAYGFLYSPLAGALAAPLTWVPIEVAAAVMSLLGLAILLAGVRLETKGLPAVDRGLVALAALGFLPVVNELLLGQVTLLLAAAVYPVRDRDGWARGIPLGVALALAPKPMLVPLLAWMLIRRRRALGGAVTTAAVVTLAGVVVMGLNLYRAWASVLTATGEVTRQGNLAITALGSPVLVLPLVAITVVAVGWVLLRDERAGFVVALLGGLLIAPYTLLYVASILLLAVRPALAVAPRSTRGLVLVANPLVLVGFIPWVATGIAASLWAGFRRPERRGKQPVL